MSRLPVVALVLALGCGKPAPTSAPTAPNPSESKGATPDNGAVFPPDDWTHKELAEHLAKKGVKIVVHAAGLPYTSSGLPVAFLHEPPDVGQPGVLVYLCRDRQHAREFAGTMGAGAFASGRFAIGLDTVGRDGSDDAAFLRRVSAALRPSP
jgi:hypothetical protein